MKLNYPEVKPRCLIFVSSGVVTDVFSTEEAMSISVVDAQDAKALDPAVQTVDDAIKAGTSDFHRIL